MEILSTSTPEAEVLAWLNEQLATLFPDMAWPLFAFYWERSTSAKQLRQRWAGWYWDSTISLDPDFFRGLPPERQSQAIIDVGLHELCHHVQRAEYGDVPTHGKEFRLLANHVNGVLRRQAVDIYHELAKTPEGEEAARAQRTALALLARTTSSNEHEAALAAAKYAEFTSKNNLSMDSHAGALAGNLPEIVKEHIWTAKVMNTWLMSVLREVAYTHGCTFTYRRTQDACTHIHFYGRSIKISQAYDMIEYLTGAIDRVVANERKKAKLASKDAPPVSEHLTFEALWGRKMAGITDPTPRGRSYWMAFREGVAQRVAKALRDDHKRRMEEGITATNGITHVPGLVLRSSFDKEEEAANEYMTWLHPSLGKDVARKGSQSAAGRSAGYAAGASVSVAKQATGARNRSLAPAAAG
jgi:hypothetical protein